MMRKRSHQKIAIELKKLEEIKLTKIADLTPRSKRVNLKVRVLEKDEPKIVFSRATGEQHRVAEALVGDETGVILMSLWNETIEKVETDATYMLKNAKITIFNNTMRLALGRLGSIDRVPEDIPEEQINRENNMSEKRYERRRTGW